MKIVSYSIINNEISFIKDLVEWHSPWLDNMYFCDTGSTDGTFEFLQEVAKINKKIIVEKYPISYNPQYEVAWDIMVNPFPEVKVRNYAINRAELLFKPDWLVQLDGDSLFLSSIRDIIEKNKNSIGIGISTIDPIILNQDHVVEFRGGFKLYDPHIRIWRANLEIHYMKNSAFANLKNDQIHCIPTIANFGYHLFLNKKISFSPEIVEFHLHWMYGDKLEKHYNNKGIFDKKEMIKDQKINEYSNLIPQIFWQRREEWLNK